LNYAGNLFAEENSKDFMKLLWFQASPKKQRAKCKPQEKIRKSYMIPGNTNKLRVLNGYSNIRKKIHI